MREIVKLWVEDFHARHPEVKTLGDAAPRWGFKDVAEWVATERHLRALCAGGEGGR